jgi:hypothetical protein
VSDPHVAAQLIERIGWALADAEDAERAASRSSDRRPVTTAVVPPPDGRRARALQPVVYVDEIRGRRQPGVVVDVGEDALLE